MYYDPESQISNLESESDTESETEPPFLYDNVYSRVSMDLGMVHLDFNPLRDPFTKVITTQEPRQIITNTQNPENTYMETGVEHGRSIVHEAILSEQFQYPNLMKKSKYFTIGVSAMVVGMYLLGIAVKGKMDYDTVSYDNPYLVMGMIGKWPGCEDDRWQIWRFFTCTWVHAGFDHVFGNTIALILMSFMLECYHSALVITPLYIMALLHSNWAFYYIQPYSYAVGVSGGVFSILGMNVANIVLNFNSIPMYQMAVMLYFSVTSLAAEYFSYDEATNIAYIAHWSGLCSGFVGGLVFLKKFIPTRFTSILSYTSIQIYVLCTFLLWYHYVYSWPPLQSYNNILEKVETTNCCYEWFVVQDKHPDQDFETYQCPYRVTYEDGTTILPDLLPPVPVFWS